MKLKQGIIFDIKRFSVHDGPGVRTTLFFKGCPLNCIWCHNPEGISQQPQLAYYEHKCINCGECVPICPEKAHSIVDGKHYFDRTKCLACGKCKDICLGNTLRLYGKEITVDEAMKLAFDDRDFYGSDGGLTLSGGEPLLQAEFCSELLKRLKNEGINTAVDTCACVGWDCIEKVLPATDIFLVDFKHPDTVAHRKLTGLGNETIIENLGRLSESGAKIEVRIPLIPGYNDLEADLLSAGKRLKRLHLEKVKVLPYNAMARTKYSALGMKDTMPQIEPPDKAAIRLAVNILCDCGVHAVSGKE
jgi:pyruvate formate lyase activating enzyme